LTISCYLCSFFFFFQAEDGIRDKLVTGVQTCALPILCDQNNLFAPNSTPCPESDGNACTTAGCNGQGVCDQNHMTKTCPPADERSEERRVGKECRSRGSPCH